MFLKYNNRINKTALHILQELEYKDSFNPLSFVEDYKEMKFIKLLALKRVIELKEEFEYSKQDYMSIYKHKYKHIHEDRGLRPDKIIIDDME